MSTPDPTCKLIASDARRTLLQSCTPQPCRQQNKKPQKNSEALSAMLNDFTDDIQRLTAEYLAEAYRIQYDELRDSMIRQHVEDSNSGHETYYGPSEGYYQRIYPSDTEDVDLEGDDDDDSSIGAVHRRFLTEMFNPGNEDSDSSDDEDVNSETLGSEDSTRSEDSSDDDDNNDENEVVATSRA